MGSRPKGLHLGKDQSTGSVVPGGKGLRSLLLLSLGSQSPIGHLLHHFLCPSVSVDDLLALTVQLRWSFLTGVYLHGNFLFIPLWSLSSCHLNAELRENLSREQT